MALVEVEGRSHQELSLVADDKGLVAHEEGSLEGVGLGESSEVSESCESSMREYSLGIRLAARWQVRYHDLARVRVSFIEFTFKVDASWGSRRGSRTTDLAVLVNDVGNVAGNGGLVEQREAALLDDGTRGEAVAYELDHEEAAC